MNRAFLKFYFDTTRFNFLFSFLIGIIISPLAGIVSLSTFGFLLSLITYKKFNGQQYYFYYNLGYSKQYLIGKSLIINLIITLPIIIPAFL